MARWSIPIEKLADKMKLDVESAVRWVAFDLFSRIVTRSPVDTGRFRANWNVSYNQIDTTTTDATEKAPGPVYAAIMQKLKAMPVGGVYYFTNSLPYANVLEYGLYPNPPKRSTGKSEGGFSKQAPHGVVRVSIAEFESAAGAVVRRRAKGR